MEEKSVTNDAIPPSDDHGWQTVSYRKKERNGKPPPAPVDDLRDWDVDAGDVSWPVQLHTKQRLGPVEARSAGDDSAFAVENDGGADVDDGGDFTDNVNAEAKKFKPKKPKVSVADAAAKIDASRLASYLTDITASYEMEEDVQLTRFVDYFGRAFSSVNSAQFPWVKMLKKSSVANMVDIPLCHIPEAVYKTSVDWLNQRSVEALSSFVLWSLDSIFADLTLHRGPVQGSKKEVQLVPSKSQVAIFVVLSMILRCKPDVLISILPIMKKNSKYQAQEKLPFIVWVIAQACQGDLVVGLFMWVRFLLLMLCCKSSFNSLSIDLIIQLAERILSFPKARTVLVNGAVKNGERLVPPSALGVLMSFTFSSAQLKATERFEAIFPTLKEIALAVSPGSKAVKPITPRIVHFAIRAVRERNPDLSREGSNLFIWSLTQNPDCYKQWDNIYMDYLEESVVILRKLSDDWNVYSLKHTGIDPLKMTLKSFMAKNKKALVSQNDAALEALLKDAQKLCKMMLGRLSRHPGYRKSMVFVTVALTLGAALMSRYMHAVFGFEDVCTV